MNKLLINTCVVAALGAIVAGSLLAEANKEHGEYGLEGHGGYGAGYGDHGGYGSSYIPGGQYLGGEHGSGLGGHGAGYGTHGGALGGLGAGLNSHLGGGYGSHGYGGEHGSYLGGHESGLYGGHHGGHHGGEGHYGKRHGSTGGQVKALLKGAGRSMLAQNPELGRKVHEITSNPSVRRGVEKLLPKLDRLGQQAKPYLREGAKVMKGKLTETVNQQNLKQGYMAAEGAGLHHHY